MQGINKKILIFIFISIALVVTLCVIYFINLQNHFLDAVLLSPHEYNISDKEKWQETHEDSGVEVGSIAGVVTRSFEKDGFLIFEVLLNNPTAHSVYFVMQFPKEVSVQNSMNINPINIYLASKGKRSEMIDYMKSSENDTLERQELSTSDLSAILETQKYFSFDVIVKYSSDRITRASCLDGTDSFCHNLILMNNFQSLKIDGKDVYVVKKILDPLY